VPAIPRMVFFRGSVSRRSSSRESFRGASFLRS
jgi:hypothetical protein